MESSPYRRIPTSHSYSPILPKYGSARSGGSSLQSLLPPPQHLQGPQTKLEHPYKQPNVRRHGKAVHRILESGAGPALYEGIVRPGMEALYNPRDDYQQKQQWNQGNECVG